MKTAIVYFAVSAFCILFDKIYSLFGHGVSSASMSLLFLYPLLGGVLLFLLISLFVPRAEEVRGCRFCYNCYNSGLATLTVGSLLKGVMEIAGTASSYLTVYTVCGWTMLAAGIGLYAIQFFRSHQSRPQ